MGLSHAAGRREVGAREAHAANEATEGARGRPPERMSAPLVEELIPVPDPLETCARFRGLPYRLFLDSARDPERLGRYSFLTADPAIVVHGKGARASVLDTRTGAETPLATHALAGVRALLAPHQSDPIPDLPPFQGGAAGYLAYDWGAVLERLPSPRWDDLAIPDVVFPIYDWVIAWDHLEHRAWVISTGLPATGEEKSQRCESRLREILRRLSSNSLSAEIFTGSQSIARAVPTCARLSRVRRGAPRRTRSALIVHTSRLPRRRHPRARVHRRRRHLPGEPLPAFRSAAH